VVEHPVLLHHVGFFRYWWARRFEEQHKRSTAMVNTNILLVDDDEDTCASMSDIFLDLGYTVDMAYDGPGALKLSAWHQYRLALLDYNMPGMDGLELCRRLKHSQPSIVVALITAFSSIAATGEASEAGVRCSLRKPVNFSVLMPLVEEVVNGSADNTPVEIGSDLAELQGLVVN